MANRARQILARGTAGAFILGVMLAMTPPVLAAGKTVVITSTLTPKSLTIAEGDRVTWRNDDDERHRMRSREEGAEFDSEDLEQGDTFSFTFSRAGTFSYVDERDDDDRAYWGTITVKAATSDQDGDEPASTKATVTIGDRVFTPATIKVAKGGSVSWVNRDDRDHTATGSGFDSGTMREGATYTKRFSTSGTYKYLCEIHPDMTGSVVVGTGGTTKPAPGSPSKDVVVPKARAGSASVKIVDLAFEPTKVTVEQNGSVTWVNAGRAPHTVTGEGFDSGRLGPGARFAKRFREPGTFSYLCVVHPEMKGTVAVKDAAGSVPKQAVTSKPKAKPNRVAIVDFDYDPGAIRVEQDAEVTWVNEGVAPHTVTGSGFDSKTIEPGGRYRRTFTEAGSFAYKCALHPQMVGTVVVGAAAGAVQPPLSAQGSQPAAEADRLVPTRALLASPPLLGLAVLAPPVLLVLLVLVALWMMKPRIVVPGDPSIEQIHERLDLKA